MEMKESLRKVPELAKKYRYVILVLILGFVLMIAPNISLYPAKDSKAVTQEVKNAISLERSLAATLAQVKGAGKVTVMLTTAAGEETVYQTDISASSTGNNHETVIVTDANRNQAGLIKQIVPPKYLGALIVCEGANDPEVCLNLVGAVSRLTGLGANQISVLKMK